MVENTASNGLAVTLAGEVHDGPIGSPVSGVFAWFTPGGTAAAGRRVRTAFVWSPPTATTRSARRRIGSAGTRFPHTSIGQWPQRWRWRERAQPAAVPRRAMRMVVGGSDWEAGLRAAAESLPPPASVPAPGFVAPDVSGWMAAATAISLWLAEASGDGSATAAAAAAPASQNSGGVWNGFVHLIETTISAISDALSAIGLPYSYGFAIIAFTILVKAITFPLNLKQMRSTLSMQALAPKLRELQARYRDNPQVMNMETARLYQEAKLNPLAGCLPVLVQLPVWIALYRALLNLAQENRLTSGFFFLPSLQGPVQQGGSLSAWLFPFKDGAPPVGWHDAIAYLVLPCLLVVTQIVSQRLLQPPQQDAQTKQANVILRFLPFMVGWFSLNVPSGLSLYWVTNNVVSTLQTIGIKRYLAKQQPELLGATGGGDAGNAAAGGNGRMADGAADGAATREPPVGFGALVSANKDGKGGGAAVTESRGSSSSSEEDGAEAKKGKRRPSKKKKR